MRSMRPTTLTSICLAAACCFVALVSSSACADGAGGPNLAVGGTVSAGVTTDRCASASWVILNDANLDAAVFVDYRKTTDTLWSRGMDLRRVDSAFMTAALRPTAGTLFSGSIFNLVPDTDYEIRLTLVDGDGANETSMLAVRTWTEPMPGTPVRTVHVAPGSGGGTGTAADPWLGFAEADANVQPGDLVLVHNGTYVGGNIITTSGTAADPIVWRAAPAETPVLDGQNTFNPALGIQDASHVIVEGLTVTKSSHAVKVLNCTEVALKRLVVTESPYSIWAVHGSNRHIWISDCDITGPFVWPRSANPSQERRAINIAGQGLVITNNLIVGHKDAVDTADVHPCSDIDIRWNDISICTDDGIELDFSDQNCRAYENRIVNAWMGVSFQPIRGGPAYAVRNLMYNVGSEPFKLHKTTTETSGAVMLHNTVVTRQTAMRVSTTDTIHRAFAANNLFVSRDDSYAFLIEAPVDGSHWDYNVFVGGPYNLFGKVDGRRFDSIATFFAGPDTNGNPGGTGWEEHGTFSPTFTGIFAGAVDPPTDFDTQYAVIQDLRPAAANPGIDTGQELGSINDGFAGSRPDAGCVEFGTALPAYGPR